MSKIKLVEASNTKILVQLEEKTAIHGGSLTENGLETYYKASGYRAEYL
ncbi:hypothetical protein H1P_110038 [Hyella patelloides LEGE 07179]|uniref:Uncharacterized protein n=1 Tax=Hyella patelloides LEGE 07179 TaxID=945734 RepID=A0A563VJH8_9CYAN|nr:hypothetical protein [Hyella patelloides]VEP11588.1 hypothetical protein H1P_110038 [Hyella patelloides LEGE 07179]